MVSVPSISDIFFELFEISKIEYKQPARMVDNDGDICAWYIEQQYPILDDVFFELLNIYQVQYNGPNVFTNLKEQDLKDTLMRCMINLYDSLNDELKQQLKDDVQDIFKQEEEV